MVYYLYANESNYLMLEKSVWSGDIYIDTFSMITAHASALPLYVYNMKICIKETSFSANKT